MHSAKKLKEISGKGGGGGGVRVRGRGGGAKDDVMQRSELASIQLETGRVGNSISALKMPPNSQSENGSNDCVQLVRRQKRSSKRSRSNSPNNDSKKLTAAASLSPSSLPVVVNFEEAPDFLQFNQYIYRGYRTNLCTFTCLKRSFFYLLYSNIF